MVPTPHGQFLKVLDFLVEFPSHEKSWKWLWQFWKVLGKLSFRQFGAVEMSYYYYWTAAVCSCNFMLQKYPLKSFWIQESPGKVKS